MLKTIASVIGFVLAVDFIFWISWALSGQTPVDGFYAGAITQHILQFIF